MEQLQLFDQRGIALRRAAGQALAAGGALAEVGQGAGIEIGQLHLGDRLVVPAATGIRVREAAGGRAGGLRLEVFPLDVWLVFHPRFPGCARGAPGMLTKCRGRRAGDGVHSFMFRARGCRRAAARQAAWGTAVTG
ncbi:hypothetical protein D3C78_1535660 [compost metagenome]